MVLDSIIREYSIMIGTMIFMIRPSISLVVTFSVSVIRFILSAKKTKPVHSAYTCNHNIL